MEKYNPKDIEPKWQKYWEENQTFAVQEDPAKEKFYALIEFPYPSGAGLHVGHPRPFTAMDVISRKRRMQGQNVLFPIGFDAFGLPTENYAIKTGRPPAEVTAENIATFTRQLKSLGFGFDWSRQVDTTDPEYMKWTQWIFLQLHKHGLAYKKNMPINWCPKDKIGLANEEVVNGGCERCGTAVEQRDKEQWMLAITKYADSLLEGLKTVDYIPQARTQQENWIGRSEGAEIIFPLRGIAQQDDDKHTVTVFTTRPDTIFGVTFLAISAELAKSWLSVGWQASDEVKNYIENTLKEQVGGVEDGEKEKTGVNAGIVAVNPVSGEEIPVWITNYVMGTVGTGAIMGVPAHDERDFDFAKKFGLPIKLVLVPNFQMMTNENFDFNIRTKIAYETLEEKALIGNGILVNSSFLNQLSTIEATEKIIQYLEEKTIGKRQVNFKLRDWVFSRQRYWGEPIPLVNCENCKGWVALPEDQLPLTLPHVEKYEPTDTGESPLAAMTDWVNTTCPQCGGAAKRETDTMPNWAGSSWYFLRYMDPHNSEALAGKEALDYWQQVDWYNGGMEHTVLHLLYSRFWNQFLFDIGVIPNKEPYKKRTSHGMILAEDGKKMSKSLGNVVNPDEMVDKFGADALRAYIMFMGPFDQAVAWDTNGLVGVKRFLERVWNLQEKVDLNVSDNQVPSSLQTLLHQTIKKVTEDIESMSFNTAIAKMMELSNEMNKIEKISYEDYSSLVKLLAPFAPHLTEELWSHLGYHESVAFAPWPEYNEELTKESVVTIVVQVNGKVRDSFDASPDITEEDAKQKALESENVKKHLEGKEPKKVIYIKGKLISIVL
jgi:leucyl-tRNA synthetase